MTNKKKEKEGREYYAPTENGLQQIEGDGKVDRRTKEHEEPYIGHIFQAVLPGHGTENKISGPRSNIKGSCDWYGWHGCQ
jgi:hypothetical protein